MCRHRGDTETLSSQIMCVQGVTADLSSEKWKQVKLGFNPLPYLSDLGSNGVLFNPLNGKSHHTGTSRIFSTVHSCVDSFIYFLLNQLTLQPTLSFVVRVFMTLLSRCCSSPASLLLSWHHPSPSLPPLSRGCHSSMWQPCSVFIITCHLSHCHLVNDGDQGGQQVTHTARGRLRITLHLMSVEFRSSTFSHG